VNEPRPQLPSRNNQPPVPSNQPPPRRPRLSGRVWWSVVAITFLFNLIFYYSASRQTTSGPQTPINFSTFTAQVNAHNVGTASFAGNTLSGNFRHPYKDSKGKTYTRYTTTILPELISSMVSSLNRDHADVTLENQTPPAWVGLLSIVLQGLPFLLLVGLLYFSTRMARQQQQGVFGFGRSSAKKYTEERPSTTFADVAGVEAAKEELREVVDFLRDPQKYLKLGARIPKGVLLIGPPGTGKTLLARAVAGEANTAFFSISSTEFVEMFVGVGASRVRDLFERAKAAAPAIVFVDELDGIGGQRGRGGPMGGGTNDEREQTLNQLLVSMDGFEANEAVIILGATNRPDVLDQALLRPGRFDRQVVLDPPDRKGREAILKIHTRQIPLASDIDLTAIAQITPGMTGADLANLANEAALTAARRGEADVNRADFDTALDRITLGSEGAALMDGEERRTVAFHEGGHTLVAMLLPNVDPVHRVTITPRGRSLGVTQFRPIDERRNYRRDYLMDRMAVGMGGRAAEEVACGEITSGAQNDIQQVTRMARAMVTQLGMSDELGPTYFGGGGDDALGGQPYNPWAPKEYSEETARRIDEVVEKLVEEAHQRAVSALSEHRAALDAIAAALVHEESLNRDQLAAIVNDHLPAGEPPVSVPPPEIAMDAPQPVGMAD